jgi:hypothetical protein
MERKSKKIKNTIKSIIKDSTIHGIPRLLKANSLMSKISWILLFICSISYCIYLIITASLSYLQYNTVTNFEIIPEIQADFPVVTICNLNQLQKNNSFYLVQKYSQMSYFSNLGKNVFMMLELSSYNETLKKSFAYSLNESLISCHINAGECWASDFVWIFDPVYGNCYSFNTGFNSSGNLIDKISISKPGNMNGLRLELSIGNPNNVPEFTETNGYHIMIHNHSYKISFNEGYDISTGVETNIAINRIYQRLKPKPFSDCMDLDSIDSFDSYFYKTIFRLNQTYRQVDCFGLCYQQKLIKECNCYTNLFNKLNGTIECLSFLQVKCSLIIWVSFVSDDYILKNCIQYCPLECDSITYQISTSFSYFPSYNYAKNLLMTNPMITTKFQNETLTYDLIKQSVLSLNVYYDKLSYIQISKDAKIEIVDLVSGIGGLLGLFLGMSFLSFAEILEMILETIVIILTRQKINLK